MKFSFVVLICLADFLFFFFQKVLQDLQLDLILKINK